MIKTCAVCGKSFKAYRSKLQFCSRACGVLGRGGPTRKASATSNARCGFCGKPIYRKPYALQQWAVVYCDRACKSAHQKVRTTGRANPNFRDAGWKTCEGCGRVFKAYDAKRRFCGVDCSQSLSVNEHLTNARRGIEAEQRCAANLKAAGYAVFRSAGSRGAFDVIAIGRDHALLISVKRTKNPSRRRTPKAVRALRGAACPASPTFRKELWCWVDKRGWCITPVEGVPRDPNRTCAERPA